MGYTNSPMVAYTKLSPNHSGQRTRGIDRITPHCVVGLCTAESLGDWFAKSSTQASSNYGIDRTGRVGMYVEEKNRSWCSSSSANDQRAVTIECASDNKEPYTFPDITYQKLIELCVDICRRNGKNKLIWFGDKDKTLNYSPKSNEMILTVHRWFANKSCPGNWMHARMGDLAEKVTKALAGSADSGDSDQGGSAQNDSGSQGSGASGKISWYRVRKTWKDSKTQKGAYKILANAKKCADENPGYKVFDADVNVVYDPAGNKDSGGGNSGASGSSASVKVPFQVKVSIHDLNIRTGAGMGYARTQFIPVGIYTIVEVKSGKGSKKGWGRLKSGAGWIALDHVTVI